MSAEPKEDFEKAVIQLGDEVEELYKFRDYFFENHPIEMAPEKKKLINAKVVALSEKFDQLAESDVPVNLRAQYLYIKGRCYNVIMEYDPRPLECFSKAVKLNPGMIEAWNELGESYWKNMNIKESQACLEGSLKRQRHRVTLRSLSILLRQQIDYTKRKDTTDNIMRSVEYAKEAVAMDPKDGISWSVLGNAYLCQFFVVAQQPGTLKLAMGAYKQAWNDAIARGTPDLPYNKGMTTTYDENYEEAMECFEMAHRLEPSWQPPVKMMKKLADYLHCVDDIVHNKGRIKTKRLQQMVKSMPPKMFGAYAPGQVCTFNQRSVSMERLMLEDMLDGPNEGKVVLGRVVGSCHSENTVPFTFAIVDESMSCVAVNVYNWAKGRGVIIGDCVCIPEPTASTHVQKAKLPELIESSELNGGNTKDKSSKKYDKMFNFRSIRINNPMQLLINGKRVGRNQFSCTKVTTCLEAR